MLVVRELPICYKKACHEGICHKEVLHLLKGEEKERRREGICHNRVSYLLPKDESRRFLPHLLQGVMEWKVLCHKGLSPLLQ